MIIVVIIVIIVIIILIVIIIIIIILIIIIRILIIVIITWFVVGNKTIEDILQAVDGTLYGIKTPCSHCFHVTCLTHWGAVKIVDSGTKEAGVSWMADRTYLQIKDLQGKISRGEADIDSITAQKESLALNTRELYGKILHQECTSTFWWNKAQEAITMQEIQTREQMRKEGNYIEQTSKLTKLKPSAKRFVDQIMESGEPPDLKEIEVKIFALKRLEWRSELDILGTYILNNCCSQEFRVSEERMRQSDDCDTEYEFADGKRERQTDRQTDTERQTL